MSDPVYVAVICEGPTERIFVDSILAPHFQSLGIYLTPVILTKKGEKGGDVKYNRLYSDLETHLRQSHNRCVTTLFDFYGLSGTWPGYEDAKTKTSPAEKQQTIVEAVKAKANHKLQDLRSDERFVPHFVMHEIEALLFSCPATLAQKLYVREHVIDEIITECGEPEAINHTKATSPSHRLIALGGFRKTSTGIAIAKEIGLPKIRQECPLFNSWIIMIENLAEN